MIISTNNPFPNPYLRGGQADNVEGGRCRTGRDRTQGGLTVKRRKRTNQHQQVWWQFTL